METLTTTILKTMKSGVKLVKFTGEGFAAVRFVAESVVEGWDESPLLTSVRVHRETAKAVLISANELGAQTWFPKSMIRLQPYSGYAFCISDSFLKMKIQESVAALLAA